MQSIFNRLNTFLLVMLVLMVGATIAILANRAGAGPLDPPAAPSSTLPQVEPRMPIPPVGWDGTFPITISQPGSYFLTEDLTDSTAGTDGIDISANHVVLDLNGFTLDGTSVGFNGVAASSSFTDVTIRNGTITGWTGNEGIYARSSSDTVEDITATANGTGVYVGSGSTVRRVIAEANTGNGIWIDDPTSLFRGCLIEDSVASRNGDNGIVVTANNVTVRNNTVERNTLTGVTVGNAADVIEDNSIIGNSQYGVNLSGVGVNHDSVVRNVFHGDTLGVVSDSGTADIIGPMDTTATSSEPWSNLSY